MNVVVYVTLQFEGFHCWPDAPLEHTYLSYPHRHLFHVRAEWAVSHDDRDIEFIARKRELEQWIETVKGPATANWSCERWALEIAKYSGACRVEVSEDGENGAVAWS